MITELPLLNICTIILRKRWSFILCKEHWKREPSIIVFSKSVSSTLPSFLRHSWEMHYNSCLKHHNNVTAICHWQCNWCMWHSPRQPWSLSFSCQVGISSWAPQISEWGEEKDEPPGSSLSPGHLLSQARRRICGLGLALPLSQPPPAPAPLDLACQRRGELILSYLDFLW